MSRAVVEKIHGKYEPLLKAGRPLLHYAFSFHLTRSPPKSDMERDSISPYIIKGLLETGCDPNQSVVGMSGMRETVWGDLLVTLWWRLCFYSAEKENLIHLILTNNHGEAPTVEEEASDDLRWRWVQTFSLFVQYGASVNAMVTVLHCHGPPTHTKPVSMPYTSMSALSIFEQAFADFEHPLVQSTRELLVSKGAKAMIEPRCDDYLASFSATTPVRASAKVAKPPRSPRCCNPS